MLEALERGEPVRYLVETAPDFHGLDLGALWEDVKAAGSAFGWISPGELRVFEPDQLHAAKAWLSAGPA